MLVSPRNAAASTDEGGNFLVTPELGLMLWTLIAFGVTLWFLSKFAFPRIQDALDKRQKAIEEAIEASERAKAEAAELLREYRERLQEARKQAEEIVARVAPRRRGERARVARGRAPASARSCSSRPAVTSRPRPGARSRRSATRSPT